MSTETKTILSASTFNEMHQEVRSIAKGLLEGRHTRVLASNLACYLNSIVLADAMRMGDTLRIAQENAEELCHRFGERKAEELLFSGYKAVDDVIAKRM